MYYFASDVHLGGGGREETRRVERRFVEWLEMVSHDARAIVLCGDIFDMWFEYKRVVPKGFTRTLAKIASLTDRGVRVIFMSGNHDMWVGDYLREECGVELYTAPHTFDLGGKLVHVAHGDNINVRGDWKLKAINKIFRSTVAFSLARTFVHPDMLLKFGHWWSAKSRNKHREREGHNTIEGYGVKALMEYATAHQGVEACDYYIFGHLHQVVSTQVEGAQLFITNDWSEDPHYAVIDEAGVMRLEKL